MIVIGAKGHAKELIVVLREKKFRDMRLYFFDNVTEELFSDFFGYPILRNLEAVSQIFMNDRNFTLGVGSPLIRKNLADKFINLGGEFVSVISEKSVLGERIKMGKGVNFMPLSSVYSDVTLGQGVLLNSSSSIHHDSIIGDYVEVSPGARILGGVRIGSYSSIGSNAVVLPGIEVCPKTIIGAGSVVTRNIDKPGVYIGIPAKKIR